MSSSPQLLPLPSMLSPDHQHAEQSQQHSHSEIDVLCHYVNHLADEQETRPRILFIGEHEVYDRLRRQKQQLGREYMICASMSQFHELSQLLTSTAQLSAEQFVSELKTCRLIDLALFICGVFKTAAFEKTGVYIECCHSTKTYKHEALKSCWTLISPMRRQGATVLFGDWALELVNSFFEHNGLHCRLNQLIPDVSGSVTLEFDAEGLLTVPNDAIRTLGRLARSGGRATIYSMANTHRPVLADTRANHQLQVFSVARVGPPSQWLQINPKTGTWRPHDPMRQTTNLAYPPGEQLCGAPAIITLLEPNIGPVIMFMCHFSELMNIHNATLDDVLQVCTQQEGPEAADKLRSAMTSMDEATLTESIQRECGNRMSLATTSASVATTINEQRAPSQLLAE